MNRTKKKISVLLLLFVLLLTSAGQVFAADKVDKEAIEKEVSAFLSAAYSLQDEELDTIREDGGFYEVFVRSWYEDRETTGDLVEVVSSEAEDPDDGQIIVNSVVEFKNYTSDVVLYLDEATGQPVNYVMNIRYSMAEKMQQAAQNMAVGLIVVFVVLIFLMFIISLFRFLAPKKKEVKKEPVSSAPAPAVVPVQEAAQPAPAQVVPQNVTDMEEEIAAVIAAALAAAAEEEEAPAVPASGYVVRSVRRNGRSVWKRV